MRVLIDIGHPGHVHLFEQFAHQMIQKGHHVHFTVRDKEFEIKLLTHEGFSFTNFGKHYKTKPGKIWGLFKFTWLVILTSLRFKPDIYLSHGSVYNAIASFFLRKPNIAMEDTGNWEQVRLYLPFTESVITSTSFHIRYGKKQIFYNGFHELAYLHPNYFKPDKSILSELGVRENEKYFLLRFVSWNATHDTGQGGLTLDQKRQLVNQLKNYGKVIISAEGKLNPEFEQYRFTLSPEKMHNVLAHAHLFIGEGATMASECAVLGTPAVYVNSMEAGTIDEQEKLGLVAHFRNGNGVIEKAIELINDTELRKKSTIAREKLLNQNIDVTAFIIWFVENFPKSKSLIKNQPEFWNQFK